MLLEHNPHSNCPSFQLRFTNIPNYRIIRLPDSIQSGTNLQNKDIRFIKFSLTDTKILLYKPFLALLLGYPTVSQGREFGLPPSFITVSINPNLPSTAVFLMVFSWRASVEAIILASENGGIGQNF